MKKISKKDNKELENMPLHSTDSLPVKAGVIRFSQLTEKENLELHKLGQKKLDKITQKQLDRYNFLIEKLINNCKRELGEENV